MAPHLMSALWLWHLLPSWTDEIEEIHISPPLHYHLKTHLATCKWFNSQFENTHENKEILQWCNFQNLIHKYIVSYLLYHRASFDSTPKSFFVGNSQQLPTWQNVQARLALRSLRSLTLAFRLTFSRGMFFWDLILAEDFFGDIWSNRFMSYSFHDISNNSNIWPIYPGTVANKGLVWDFENVIFLVVTIFGWGVDPTNIFVHKSGRELAGISSVYHHLGSQRFFRTQLKHLSTVPTNPEGQNGITRSTNGSCSRSWFHA